MENNRTDVESPSSLKYEKTQNRDVIGTIERINRSQKFRPVSEKVLDLLGKIASESATKAFRQEWRNKHESHENPPPFNIEVFIGSPLFRRHIEDFDFHYSMTVSTSFVMDFVAMEGETSIETETRMTSWFMENVAKGLNNKVVEEMNSALLADPETKDLFSFTLLQKAAEDDANKIGGKKPVNLKINLSYMTTLKPKKDTSSTTDILSFKDSEFIRDGLISNISLAVERINGRIKEEC